MLRAKPDSKHIMQHPRSRPRFLPLSTLGALALVGLALTGCNRKSDAPSEPAQTTAQGQSAAKQAEPEVQLPLGASRPALWKLSDDDTTIFLFGGVHMLPTGLDWQSGMVNEVINSADMLVLELSPEEQAKAPDVLASIAADSPQDPIEERIPPQFVSEFEKLASRTRISRAQLDGMESWAAALMLGNAVSRNAALSLDNGTEKQLTKRFEAQGKPVSGLETAEYQLGLFDSLSQQTQDILLARTIGDAETASAKFDRLIAAWAKGDTDSVAYYADSELRAVPGLALPLLTRRNQQWAAWIRDRMEAPGTILIAVGTGHLVGDDSVQSMLEAQGYKVERVQ